MAHFIFILAVLVAVFYGISATFRKITARKPLELNKNSVVVLTGGCEGLGRLTAIQLAKRFKCNLVILDILSSRFGDLTKSIEALGSQILCLECDLTSKESMDKAINEIKERYLQIDVLVNNAGIAFQYNFEEASTYERNLKTLSVNYLAPVHLFHSLIDQLKGHVVNIASIASIIRGDKLSSYVASKAALYGFFNCVRTEIIDRRPNISISLVCPWAIDTGMFEGFRSKMEMIVPLLRPQHVVNVIVDTIVNREEVVFIPKYIGLVSKIINLLPDYFVDRITRWGDQSAYTNKRHQEN